MQEARQRRGDIAESAGLGERRVLGGNEQNPIRHAFSISKQLRPAGALRSSTGRARGGHVQVWMGVAVRRARRRLTCGRGAELGGHMYRSGWPLLSAALAGAGLAPPSACAAALDTGPD